MRHHLLARCCRRIGAADAGRLCPDANPKLRANVKKPGQEHDNQTRFGAAEEQPVHA